MSLFSSKAGQIREFLSQEWDKSVIPKLSEYIAIPNQSPDYDPEWKTNGLIEKAMDLIVEWVKAQPLTKVKAIDVHREAERTPFLLIEIEGCSQSMDTVLMYGHMDKQPPMEFPPWDEGLGPYKPVIRDGKLYGRGGADDGYSVFSAVTAVLALQKHDVPHGRIVIIIEGCEESGSFDLDFYMNKCKEQIGDVGVVICLDSGAFTYDRMWVTGSLRGVVGGTVRVKTLTEPIHSGLGGGVCPCPFRVARHLLDRIEDPASGDVRLKELFVDPPEHALKGFQKLSEIGSDVFVQQFPLGATVVPEVQSRNQTELLVRNNWKPSLTVVGLTGLPQCPQAGNVIQSTVELKISMRLPPSIDCDKATEILWRVLTKDPPFGAEVTFHPEVGGNGWFAKALPAWLQNAVDGGSSTFFGNPSGYCAIGGSIPFMKMLGDWYPKASFVVTGVLGPKSNAHGPNEFLHIDFAKKLTCIVSQIIADHHSANA